MKVLNNQNDKTHLIKNLTINDENTEMRSLFFDIEAFFLDTKESIGWIEIKEQKNGVNKMKVSLSPALLFLNQEETTIKSILSISKINGVNILLDVIEKSKSSSFNEIVPYLEEYFK